MRSAVIVQEARRRAGITQAELGRRVGTTQSAIARVERGTSAPSLERVAELVEACGFELGVSVAAGDDAELASLRRNLELTYDQRWQRTINLARFIHAGRTAMAGRVG